MEFYSNALFACAIGSELRNYQLGDMPVVTGVRGEQCLVVFNRGGGDQCVRELHGVTEAVIFDVEHGSPGYVRGDLEDSDRPAAELPLQYVELLFIADSLEQLNVGNGGNVEREVGCDYGSRGGVATQIPDQDVCINDHARDDVRSDAPLEVSEGKC